MKFDLYTKASITLVVILSASNLAWAADYTPNSLLVTLFTDGKALIEYRLNTDTTVPAISVPLFGKTYDQLIVVDDQNQLIESKVEGDKLVMNTLGTSNVLITYTTSDLVNKTGKLWTFSIDSPVDTTIKLPNDSVIIGLNQIPNSIKASENEYLLVMPEGHAEVSYVIGALGTKEHANAAISDADKTISDLKANGVIVSAAESKLAEAKKAFESGKYSDAEKLANDAKTLANTANENAKLVTKAITDAEASIQEAKKQGVSTTDAEQLLSKALLENHNGNYEESLTLAQQAKASAVNAVNSKPKLENGPEQMYIFAGLIAAAAGGAGAAMYMRSRKKAVVIEQPERVEPFVKEKRVIDLNKIFSEKPYLRQEDKDTVNYLAENGGEAFESEIRDKFQLPKTTVWRLVKRLEREDLVEVKKAGGQNLIRIRGEFTRVDQPSPGSSGK